MEQFSKLNNNLTSNKSVANFLFPQKMSRLIIYQQSFITWLMFGGMFLFVKVSMVRIDLLFIHDLLGKPI